MKKFMPFIFAGLNIVAMVVGLFLVYSSTMGFEAPTINEERAIASLEEAKALREDSPLIYTMDVFTVNLDGYPKRIIQTEINLVLLDKSGFEEIIRAGSKARDSVMSILSSKTFSDIETVQGKLFLKDQIASRLNSMMAQGVVKDVYFSDFIVK